MTEDEIKEVIEEAGGRTSHPVRLAQVVCMAVRVDWAYLRRARLDLLHGVGPSAEADLWAGPLVHSRGPDGFVLRTDVAKWLQHKLAGKDDGQIQLKKAGELMLREHKHLPPAFRLEEQLTYWGWRSDKDDDTLARELGQVVRALEDPARRSSLTTWMERALDRLPARVQDLNPAQELRGAVILWSPVGSRPVSDAPVGVDREVMKRLLRSSGHRPFLLRMAGGVLEVAPKTPDASPPAGSPPSVEIQVPETTPPFIEVRWTDGDEPQSAQVSPRGEKPVRLTVGRNLELRFVDGTGLFVLPGEASLGLVNENVVGVLDDLPEAAVEAAAARVGAAPAPIAPLRRLLAGALVRSIHEGGLSVLTEVLEALESALPPQDAARLFNLLTPLWVNIKAALQLRQATLHPPGRRGVFLNCTDPLTAELYIRRGWLDEERPLVITLGAVAESLDETLAQVEDALARQVRVEPQELREFLHAYERPLFLLLDRSRLSDDAMIPALAERYPEVTLFLYGQHEPLGARTVYLICDENDQGQDDFEMMRDFLTEEGYDVEIPVFTGSEDAVREAHEKQVAACDAVILFYGAGSEAWMRFRENDLRKMTAYQGNKPKAVSFTYVAHPSTNYKELMIVRAAPNVINGLDGFQEEEKDLIRQAVPVDFITYLKPLPAGAERAFIPAYRRVRSRWKAEAEERRAPKRESKRRTFETDVFISYDYGDNQSSREEEPGWVTRFQQYLESYLSTKLGREANIFRDEKRQSGVSFVDQTVDRLSQTAVFIAILSPRYLRSKWGAQEVEAFSEAARQTGGVVVDDTSRILKVIKSSVSLEQQPAVMRDSLGYEFFQREEGKELPRDKDLTPEAYRRQIYFLAEDIAGFIEKVEGGVVEEEAPFAEAEAIPDVEGSAVEGEAPDEGVGHDAAPHDYVLLDAGAGFGSVLISYALPESPEQDPWATQFSEDLRKILMQRLGMKVEARRGDGPQGNTFFDEDRIGPLEEPAALIVVLTPRYLESERCLREVRTFCDAARQSFGVVVNMKSRILKAIQEPVVTEEALPPEVQRAPNYPFSFDEMEPPAVQRVAQDLAELLEVLEERNRMSSAPSGRTLVYLICDERDREAAQPVVTLLRAQGYDVNLPRRQDDEAAAQQAHEESLRRCDAVLIYYGEADARWVEARVQEVKQAPRVYGRKNTITPTSAVYVAGPETKRKAGFHTDDVDEVITQIGEFSPEALIPFLDSISARYQGDLVSLSVAVPRAVRPDHLFRTRFVAHGAEQEQQVDEVFGTMSPRFETHLGLQTLRLQRGVRVTLRLSSGLLTSTGEPEMEFVWGGEPIRLDYEVVVPKEVSSRTAALSYEVYVDGAVVAKLRLEVEITDEPPAAERTAYASFADADRGRVLDHVDTLRVESDLDILLDTPAQKAGKGWQEEMRKEIEARDEFILFWSVHAVKSSRVEREWRRALEVKGLDAIRPIALDPLDVAPPPEELSRLHFGDTYGRPDQALEIDGLIEQGGLRFREGELEQAMEYYDEALEVSQEIGDRSREGNVLVRLGQASANLLQLDQAMEYYQQALVILQEIGDRQGEGNVLVNLGLVYVNQKRERQALVHYDQALAIAKEIGDRSGESTALVNLGVAYANLGELAQATTYYEQALVIMQEVGDRQGEGYALVRLGHVRARLGEVEPAIQFYEQALAILREVGDQQEEGNALFALGEAHADLGHVQEAITYYEQVLAIAQELGDRQGEGNALVNLGNGYTNLGQGKQAIEYIEQALVIVREIGDRQGESSALVDLGMAYVSLDEFRKAIEYIEQALVIVRGIEDRQGEGNVLIRLGDVYVTLGQEEQAMDEVGQAMEYYQQALAIVRKIGDRRWEGGLLVHLGDVLADLGEVEQAQLYLEEALVVALEIKDSGIEDLARSGLAGLEGGGSLDEEVPLA